MCVYKYIKHESIDRESPFSQLEESERQVTAVFIEFTGVIDKKKPSQEHS